jgi:hypothetical protein
MSTFGTQSDFSNAFGQQSGAVSDFSNAVTGAGFADQSSVGPDLEVSWDDIRKNQAYEGLDPAWLPNYDTANFSDAVIDWRKFDVNRTMPMDYDQLITLGVYGPQAEATDEFGNPVAFDESAYDEFGNPVAFDESAYKPNIRVVGINDIQKLIDGQWQHVDTYGSNDSDPTDIMGWMDPRVDLIMNNAPGWNDPLSNWLQKQGEHYTADAIGKLNYRARSGDSSYMYFTPEAYWPHVLGADAASVLGADPDQVAALQQQWNEAMSPGAQSARHDAMFGDSFSNFLGDLMPILGIAGLAFGLPSLFAGEALAGTTAAEMLGAQAASDLAMGFSLGDVALGLEGIGGLSGLGGAGLATLGGLDALTGYAGLESLGMSELGAAGLGDLAFGVPVADATLTVVDPALWQEGSLWEDITTGLQAPYNAALEAWQAAKLDPRVKLARILKSGYDNINKLMADPYGDMRMRMEAEMAALAEERAAQLEEQDAALSKLKRRAPKWIGANNFIGGRI